MIGTRAVVLCCLCASALAQVCDPSKLAGSYALQLSGTTTVSGDEKPATSLARVVFDGHGKLSGISSTMFSGFLLANPVTGSYEARADCSLAWKLQDDSGAFQNFAGTLAPDLARGQFRQTDPGAPQRGLILKSLDKCNAQDLRPRYAYAVSGSTTPMQEGGSRQTISAKGTVDIARNGSFQVDSDCVVQFDLVVLDPAGREQWLRMRGILVSGGQEILGIETDPGAMVSARLSAPQ